MATTYNWNNTGTDYNTASDWTTAFVPSGNNTAGFNVAGTTNPNLSTSLSVAGLDFSAAAASGYDVKASSGQSFTFTGYGTTGGTSNSTEAAIYSIATGTNTIDASFILSTASGSTSTVYQSGAAGTLTLNGAISNSGPTTTTAFNLGTNASIYLNGTNSLTGSVTLSSSTGGTYNIGNNSAFGNATVTLSNSADTIVASGAARTLGNAFLLAASPTIGGSNALTINGAITLSGSSHTLTVNNAALTTLGGSVYLADSSTASYTLSLAGTGTTTIGGVIANNAGTNTLASNITFAQTGTVTLTNSNSYSGNTTIGSTGTTAAANTHAFGDSATIAASSAGILSFLGDTSTSFTTATSGTVYNVSESTSGLTINADSATPGVTTTKTMTIGNVSVTRTTGANVNFTGADNTSLTIGAFTGSTGSTNTNGVETNTLTNNIASGGSLTLAGYVSAASVATGSDGITFTGTGNTTVTGALATSSSGAPLSLSMTGSGVLTLQGASTYAGTSTASAGTIDVSNANAIQNSTLILTRTGSSPNYVYGAVTFDASAGTSFNFGGLAANYIANTIALQNNASTPAAIALTVGSNNANTTFSGTITGLGSLTKTGNGVLTLSNTNPFSGGTTISGGTVSTGSSLYYGATTSTTTIQNGAILSLTNTTSIFSTYSHNYALGTGGGEIDITNANFAIDGIISGGNLIKGGSGTLILVPESSGGTLLSNTYTGGTTVNAGTLQFNTTGALSHTSSVVLAAGTTLSYSNTNVTTAALSAPVTLNGSSGTGPTVLIDNGTQTFTLSGAVTGTGSLIKTGASTLALSNVGNSYSGGTTVSAGTLQVNTTGSGNSGTGSGNVTISNGAVLAGGTSASSGQVAGNVTVSGGATITAGTGATTGDTVGTLTTAGSLTLTTGTTAATEGTYYAKVNAGTITGSVAAPNTGSDAVGDVLVMSGLNFSSTTGSANVSLNGLAAGTSFSVGSELVIAQVQNVASGYLASLLSQLSLTTSNVTTNGGVLALAEEYTGGSNATGTDDLVIQDEPASAPEPTSALLFGLAAMPILAERRRRNTSLKARV